MPPGFVMPSPFPSQPQTGPWGPAAFHGMQSPPLPAPPAPGDAPPPMIPEVKRPNEGGDITDHWREMTRTPSLGAEVTFNAGTVFQSKQVADVSLPYPDDFAVYIQWKNPLDGNGTGFFPFQVRISMSSGGAIVEQTQLLPVTGLLVPLRTARATVTVETVQRFLDLGADVVRPVTFGTAVARGRPLRYDVDDYYSIEDGSPAIANQPIPAFARVLRIQADDDSPTGAGSASFSFMDSGGTPLWTLDPNGLGALPGLSPGRAVRAAVPRLASQFSIGAPAALGTTSNITMAWECYA